MVELSGKSAGVSVREIDLTGPRNATPVGVPAGVIGTADRGPAFVPLTFASVPDFVAKFGDTDGTKFGPLAVAEWLRNAQAVTFLRILGIGRGERRLTSGDNAGSVQSAGFVVGQRLPDDSGLLADNTYANSGGPLGRLHFLGCHMSESAGSTVFSSAGIQTAGTNVAAPIIRGVILAPSGVVPMLSSSFASDSSAPTAGLVSTSAGPRGAITGTVDTSSGRQNFVLLLNGHKGTDSQYPNVITASFDQTAPNYFGNVLNTNPLKIQEAGHLLYTRYDVHPTQAVVTGAGVINSSVVEQVIAFITTGSAARNNGSTTVPSYENFEERFTTPATPTIISQKFGGNYLNLFRIHALSDGQESNVRFKVSIQNIAKSTVNDQEYGTFDLLVRDFNDTDDNRVVLESYAGLTLNPESDNYIAARIGDMHAYYDFDKNAGGQKLVVDGKYPNLSNLIRVEMDNSVENGELDPSALPIGFRGPYHLVTSGSDPLTAVQSDVRVLQPTASSSLKRAVEPPVPFRENIAVGVEPKKTVNKQLYWGVQFEQKVSLAEPNASRVANKTLASMTKFLPRHQTTWQNVSVGENNGTPDVNGTVLDSDRFNNNLFALDRIRVRTGSSGVADSKEFASASYIRNGQIATDDANKLRALSVATDFGDLSVRSIAKFNVFVQGGFDGTNIFNVDTAGLTNAAVVQEMDDVNRGQDYGPTVRSYKKALDVMGNVSDVDIKLLAIPGIRHNVVTDYGIQVIENDRFDALYIMDIEERDTLNSVVTSSLQDINVTNTATAMNLRGLDSNFAASYFPNVVVQNQFNGLPVEVPPSVAVLGAFALNDAVAFPWFAPAGFTRGALQTTDSAAVLLNQDNMDTLQDANINPIVSFPGSSGVVIWGQKTLQAAQSALDRVNVRRLLIDVRRQVRRLAETIIFEPNREATLNRFSSLVNPVLQRIQEQQGVERFKVIIDASTTTQADVENNTIRGKIFLTPTRTAETVSIDFVLTNAGAQV
jgi:phage tail sheath protein FI